MLLDIQHIVPQTDLCNSNEQQSVANKSQRAKYLV